MEDGGEMVSEEEEEEDSDCILNERGSLKRLLEAAPSCEA